MKNPFIKLSILFVAFIMQSCGNQFEVPETKSQTTPAQPVAPTPKQNWSYSSKVDEMEGTKINYAECLADTRLLFDFPYKEEGGSSFELVLRKNKTFDIFLTVSSGQFMSAFNGRSAKFKFDDEKPFKVTYNGASDGSSNIIFFNNTTKLLNKLKVAKKLKIEVVFYDYGNQIIEFNVGGLKWEK